MLLKRLSSLAGASSDPARVWADPDTIRDGYDVVVVGGGARAVAVARACAADGAEVALFAPGEIAAAADERAWPVLRSGKADAYRVATDRTAPQLLRRAARAGRTRVKVEKSGCLTIAASPAEVEALTRRAADLKAQNVAAWMVPSREIDALSPPLSGLAFPAALYEQDAETVDADALALALARDAAKHGARLFPAMPAAALERSDRSTGLRLGERVVACDALVLADDLSAIRLIREGKGRLSLVRDERTLLTTTAPAPSFGPAIEIGDLRISSDHAGAVEACGPRGADGIARDLVDLAPSLGAIEVASEERVIAWRGIDGLAQVGAAEIPHLWLALGFGRDALALALPAAEHLAASIAGRRGSAAFAAFAPARQRQVRDMRDGDLEAAR